MSVEVKIVNDVNYQKLDYEKIQELWNTGEHTMQSIGKLLGRSRERIHQVMAKIQNKIGYSIKAGGKEYLKINNYLSHVYIDD